VAASTQVEAYLGEKGAIGGTWDEVGEALLEAQAEGERSRGQGELGAGSEAEAGATDRGGCPMIGEAQVGAELCEKGESEVIALASG
jgi:hypothetical protein